MAIMPYTATTPRPYYIIGMANGAWSNSAAGLGVSIYPMSVITGNKYNTTGDGEFTFTGYFWASRGFKLIRDLGNWDEQWGIKDGVYVHNDGGSTDIKVAADGYYTITLNSITNTMTMIPALVAPTQYTTIGLIGGFNGWGGDVVMTAAESTNNHIWYTTQTFTTDGSCKFRELMELGQQIGEETHSPLECQVEIYLQKPELTRYCSMILFLLLLLYQAIILIYNYSEKSALSEGQTFLS